jgi:hypothetical protein
MARARVVASSGIGFVAEYAVGNFHSVGERRSKVEERSYLS